jgi:hypothetical protein
MHDRMGAPLRRHEWRPHVTSCGERTSRCSASWPGTRGRGRVRTPGRNSLTTSPDGTADWLGYHTEDAPPDTSGGNKLVHGTVPARRSRGTPPRFGRPVPSGVRRGGRPARDAAGGMWTVRSPSRLTVRCTVFATDQAERVSVGGIKCSTREPPFSRATTSLDR